MAFKQILRAQRDALGLLRQDIQPMSKAKQPRDRGPIKKTLNALVRKSWATALEDGRYAITDAGAARYDLKRTYAHAAVHWFATAWMIELVETTYLPGWRIAKLVGVSRKTLHEELLLHDKGSLHECRMRAIQNRIDGFSKE